MLKIFKYKIIFAFRINKDLLFSFILMKVFFFIFKESANFKFELENISSRYFCMQKVSKKKIYKNFACCLKF